MKQYNIPIIWQSYKKYPIEAESLEEAVRKALKQFFNEPDDNYINNSFEIDNIVSDYYPNEDFDINRIINTL